MIPLQRLTRETPVGADVILIDDNHRPVLTNTRSEIFEIDTAPPIEMVKLFGRGGGYMAHRVFVLPRNDKGETK